MTISTCHLLIMVQDMELDNDSLPSKDIATAFYQKYEPKEILGKGVSSTVRRAVSKETGDSFAVKIIDVSQELVDSDGLNLREQTIREINILRQVAGHDHIIELLDVLIEHANAAIGDRSADLDPMWPRCAVDAELVLTLLQKANPAMTERASRPRHGADLSRFSALVLRIHAHVLHLEHACRGGGFWITDRHRPRPQPLPITDHADPTQTQVKVDAGLPQQRHVLTCKRRCNSRRRRRGTNHKPEPQGRTTKRHRGI